MDIKIERIYLRTIGKEFIEFNRAVHQNQARLEPWFWWANIGKTRKFYFICLDAFFNKLAKIMPDLPRNKKFIIRIDGRFGGMIGLDGIYRGAPRPEVWMFLTQENEGRGIATHAIEWATKYAESQSCKTVRARTNWDNLRARVPLLNNGFEVYDTEYYVDEHILWYEKVLCNKSIEK